MGYHCMEPWAKQNDRDTNGNVTYPREPKNASVCTMLTLTSVPVEMNLKQ